MEVPDNRPGACRGMCLDEFMAIIDNSLENGYTVDWAADVSEPGFQYSKGFAVIPAGVGEDAQNTEWSKWRPCRPIAAGT